MSQLIHSLKSRNRNPFKISIASDTVVNRSIITVYGGFNYCCHVSYVGNVWADPSWLIWASEMAPPQYPNQIADSRKGDFSSRGQVSHTCPRGETGTLASLISQLTDSKPWFNRNTSTQETRGRVPTHHLCSYWTNSFRQSKECTLNA